MNALTDIPGRTEETVYAHGGDCAVVATHFLTGLPYSKVNSDFESQGIYVDAAWSKEERIIASLLGRPGGASQEGTKQYWAKLGYRPDKTVERPTFESMQSWHGTWVINSVVHTDTADIGHVALMRDGQLLDGGGYDPALWRDSSKISILEATRWTKA